jgi:hypothetical protein
LTAKALGIVLAAAAAVVTRMKSRRVVRKVLIDDRSKRSRAG